MWYSGIYGVEKQRCARAAYEGLMEFVRQLQTAAQSARHLQHVHFVNIDEETTDAMVNVMRSLYEKKFMFTADVGSGGRVKTGGGGVTRNTTWYVYPDTNTQNVAGKAALESVDGLPEQLELGKTSSVQEPPQRRKLKKGSKDDGPALVQSGSRQCADASTETGKDAVNGTLGSANDLSGQSEPAEASSERVQPSRRKLKDPSASSSKDDDSEVCGNIVKEPDKGQESSSDNLLQNDSTSPSSDHDAQDIPARAVTDDSRRDSKATPDAAASSAEETKLICDICKSRKPICRQLACCHLACQECIKACSEGERSCCEGKDGKHSPSVNDESTGASAAAADNDERDADDLKQQEASSKRPRSRVLKKDECVICLEQMTESKQLECGHKFCTQCIDDYFEKGQPKCPSCGRLFGMLKGNQPSGTFTWRCIPRTKLSGYEHHGAIEIMYHIPDGVQTVSYSCCVLCLTVW